MAKTLDKSKLLPKKTVIKTAAVDTAVQQKAMNNVHKEPAPAGTRSSIVIPGDMYLPLKRYLLEEQLSIIEYVEGLMRKDMEAKKLI